jgi:hypothetical protein
MEDIWEESAEQNILFTRKELTDEWRKHITESSINGTYHKIILGPFSRKTFVRDIIKLCRRILSSGV